MGEEWKGGDMSQPMREEEDARGVLLAGKDEIVQKFKAFDAKVVFGAEDFCWPDQSLKEKYPKVEQGYRDE